MVDSEAGMDRDEYRQAAGRAYHEIQRAMWICAVCVGICVASVVLVL